MTHDSLEDLTSRLALGSILVAGIACVVFGQVTVRKLRRNPATRDGLGTQFVHGGDIVLVAQALTWPRRLQERAENGSLGFLVAKSQVLRAHTTALDRALGAACYCSVIACLILLLGSYLVSLPA